MAENNTQTPEEKQAPALAAPPAAEPPAAAAPISQLPKTPIPAVKPLEPLKPSETTEGRVKQMTTTRSPLLTTVATRARQRMAGRGILSSSLTEQAAQQAVIETATPIAAQDAAAAQREKEIQFQAEQATAAEGREAERQRTGILFQTQEARAVAKTAADARREEIKTELASKYDIIQFEADVRANEADLQRQWQDANVSDQNSRVLAEQYRASVNTANQYWDSQTQLILNTPDSVMSSGDKRKRLSQIESSRASAIESTTSTYAAAPDWDTSWGVEVIAPAVDGVGTPAGLGADLAEAPIFTAEIGSKSNFKGDDSFLFSLDKLESGELGREDVVDLIEHIKFRIEQETALTDKNYYGDIRDLKRSSEKRIEDANAKIAEFNAHMGDITTYLEDL